MRRIILPAFSIIVVLMAFACDNVQEPVLTQDEQAPLLAPKAKVPTGDPAVLAKISEINGQLAKQDLNIAVAAMKPGFSRQELAGFLTIRAGMHRALTSPIWLTRVMAIQTTA